MRIYTDKKIICVNLRLKFYSYALFIVYCQSIHYKKHYR